MNRLILSDPSMSLRLWLELIREMIDDEGDDAILESDGDLTLREST